MSVHVRADALANAALLVEAPASHACTDQSFELPAALYAAMALLLGGFLAVLAVGLASPGIAVPMAINFVFLAAFFAVPALFVRAGGARQALGWDQLMRRGIMTATGHCPGKEAALLVLILPALIFAWALAIVTVVALA